MSAIVVDDAILKCDDNCIKQKQEEQCNRYYQRKNKVKTNYVKYPQYSDERSNKLSTIDSKIKKCERNIRNEITHQKTVADKQGTEKMVQMAKENQNKPTGIFGFFAGKKSRKVRKSKASRKSRKSKSSRKSKKN
jgi:hypothetical protein